MAELTDHTKASTLLTEEIGSSLSGDDGIPTARYKFEVGKDRQVICSVMIMEKSCFLWISTPDDVPTLGSMSTAIPTRFDSMPISSALLGSDDMSSEIAQRLSKRFNIQVFISCNLPETYEDDMVQINSKLVDILKETFSA
jgi:hypothetical protein